MKKIGNLFVVAFGGGTSLWMYRADESESPKAIVAKAFFDPAQDMLRPGDRIEVAFPPDDRTKPVRHANMQLYVHASVRETGVVVKRL